MKTLIIKFEFDGTDFVGWQMQPNQRSLQGELTKAFELKIRDKLKIIAAGRTDAGVHGKEQIATIKINDIRIPENKIVPATEYEVQQYMHQQFRENRIVWDHGPIVGINEHAGDPHFEPTPENSHQIKENDLVLIDLFARFEDEGSIYYDVTWMGYVGERVPVVIEKLFGIIRDARDAGYQLVKDRFNRGEDVSGAEVDDAVRNVIVEAGYGDYYWHRTGHNIATECHGNGAHIDNLETKDDRILLKGTIFSIEPGIYIPEDKLGFRTEIDVIINNNGKVEDAGAIQEEIVKI